MLAETANLKWDALVPTRIEATQNKVPLLTSATISVENGFVRRWLANGVIDAGKRCLGYVKTFTKLKGSPPAKVLFDDLASVDYDVAAVELDTTPPRRGLFFRRERDRRQKTTPLYLNLWEQRTTSMPAPCAPRTFVRLCSPRSKLSRPPTQT